MILEINIKIFMDRITGGYSLIQAEEKQAGLQMEQHCPWFNKCWSFVTGKWEFITLFFLLLYVFEIANYIYIFF